MWLSCNYRTASGERGVQRDGGAGQRLADGAALLGRLGGLLEPGRVQAVDLTADGELDPREAEPARRVGAERDVGLHVEGLRGAAGLGDVGRELHREARGVRGRDQLLGAGGAAGVVGRALGEADVVRADVAAAELDLAGPLLQRAGPGGAGGASGHVDDLRVDVPSRNLAPSGAYPPARGRTRPPRTARW